MVAKNETENNELQKKNNDLPDEDLLGRRERKKRQRQLDYENRRKLWLSRYGSADALRSTFGSGPPWGDLTPQQTRAFYHILLPRSLLALSEMGLMKPDELAPLAYEARIAAKEYARSRCVWTGRVATAAFDQYRSLRDRGRLIGPGSSSSMSWEEVWEKYEAQIVEEECAEVIDEESSNNKKKEKKKKLWGKNKKIDKEESLTMRIYMRILEKSCATNKAFDSLFLSGDEEDMAHIDLAAIAAQLENDIHSILLSPKENIEREKKVGKMNKKMEKDREREEKRQRKAKKKEEEERRKELKKQEKLMRKEYGMIYQNENEEDTKQIWGGGGVVVEEDEDDDDDGNNNKKHASTDYSKRAEALRILASTRRQFRILFPKKKNH